jgi:hypothetical protein
MRPQNLLDQADRSLLRDAPKWGEDEALAQRGAFLQTYNSTFYEPIHILYPCAEESPGPLPTLNRARAGMRRIPNRRGDEGV